MIIDGKVVKESENSEDYEALLINKFTPGI